MLLKFPTDSMAKEYVYSVDIDVHSEPFAGEFYWDTEKRVVAPDDCPFDASYRGGAVIETTPEAAAQVTYVVPIYVKKFTGDGEVHVCIPYSSELLKFSLDENDEITFTSGDHTANYATGLTKKSERHFK